jgi:hypothetical protein
LARPVDDPETSGDAVPAGVDHVGGRPLGRAGGRSHAGGDGGGADKRQESGGEAPPRGWC